MRKLWLLLPALASLTILPALAAPKNGMAVIPEPGSMATLGVALAGLAFFIKKRK